MEKFNLLIRTALERAYFEDLTTHAMRSLKSGEHLFMGLAGEATQFIRVNGGKIRQIGTVEEAALELTFVWEKSPGALRRCTRSLNLSGISYEDREAIDGAIRSLREEVVELPQDPYAQLPSNPGSSAQDRTGNLLSIDEASERLLSPLGNGKVDLVGIYSSGPIVRAMANSAGLSHWFSTETFSFDYSIYTPSQRALKGTHSGSKWDQGAYEREIASAQAKLSVLERPPRQVPRGAHRAYLAPAALHEVLGMFSWECVSEAAIRQGDSPLRRLRSGERELSPKFSLTEDFTPGDVPRFNDEGELAPECLALIDQGRLNATLVSSRTALEYKIQGNGAETNETLRSPAIAPGKLKEPDILKSLGTGLYLSNLHYLNWSDQPGGRITGMTRYACFWVENGEIVAPIENLRFDDTLFSLFGDSLEDLTDRAVSIPDVGTYGMRNLGSARVPGALVSSMKFTL